MQYFNTPVFTNQTNPGSGTVASAAVDARFYVNATCSAIFSDGAAAGTLKIQGSNDPATTPAAASWKDIASMAATVTAGGTVTTVNTSIPLCCQWVRVVWAPSAGAGTFTAQLHMNGY